MTTYCAACIYEQHKATRSGPVSGMQSQIKEAVTLMEGTALCLDHARWWAYVATRITGVKV